MASHEDGQHGADKRATSSPKADGVVKKAGDGEVLEEKDGGALDQGRHHPIHLRVHMEQRQVHHDAVQRRDTEFPGRGLSRGDTGVVAIDHALWKAGRTRGLEDAARFLGTHANRLCKHQPVKRRQKSLRPTQ